MEVQDIRNVPVEDYMLALGYAPVRKSANELLYHAPYREDKRPSFRVNVAKVHDLIHRIISFLR